MAPKRYRGVSGVTLRDFFIAVLRGLGAPVTENNLAKLGAIARLEGHGGDYNPFNYVIGPANATNFNSVGVKNYPDVLTGIQYTIRLLRQKNTTAMRNNLLSNGSYQDWLNAASRFYQSWGGPAVRIGYQSALSKLNEQVDGPPVPASHRTTINSGTVSAGFGGGGGGGGVAPVADPDPHNWAGIARWIESEHQRFQNYLGYLQTKEQEQLIKKLQSLDRLSERDPAKGLRAWADFLKTAAPEVRHYVQNFLAKLPNLQQNVALHEWLKPVSPRIGPPPQPPTASPQMSKELQTLLKNLGVDYKNAPVPTPALLAFLRGVGSSLSTAEDLRRRAVEQINQRSAAAVQDLERAGERAKTSLTSNLIARGVLRSGEANTRYAEHEQDVAARRASIERDRVSGVSQADMAYQQARDQARQQALERVLGVEEQQQANFAAAKAQYDAILQQMREADRAWERERQAMEENIRRQEELMKRYAAQGLVL